MCLANLAKPIRKLTRNLLLGVYAVIQNVESITYAVYRELRPRATIL